MSPHVFNRAESSGISNELTDFVHSRIEECMQVNMSKEDTVKLIFDTFGIMPNFTRSIWNLLEKANPDFFRCFKTHCEQIQNALISKADEDLPVASTSYGEPYNKPRARRSNEKKQKKLQQLLSAIDFLMETAPNDESSQVPQEATTANADGSPIPLKQISSKARRSKARKKAKKQKQQASATEAALSFEKAGVSQESLPSADAEIILKEISTTLGLLESIIEPVHKLLSNGFVPPRSATKVLKKQRSWEQVRNGYEQAEILQDLNQQLKQEMQRLEIPGNQANEEDTLCD